MLAALPEKKALIYFSGGVSKTGIDNQGPARSLGERGRKGQRRESIPSTRAALWPTLPEAQRARPPRADRRLQRIGLQSAARPDNDSQENRSRPLAADTGGKAFFDSNDLALGIEKVQEELRQLLHHRVLHHQWRETASIAA